MSKCSVRSTLKSSFRYWTLFCPKYWAELSFAVTTRAPIARQHTTTAWKLCRTFMRIVACKALTYCTGLMAGLFVRVNTEEHRETGLAGGQHQSGSGVDGSLCV